MDETLGCLSVPPLPSKYDLLEDQIEELKRQQEQQGLLLRAVQTALMSPRVTNRSQQRDKVSDTQSVMIEHLVRDAPTMSEAMLRVRLIQLAKC